MNLYSLGGVTGALTEFWYPISRLQLKKVECGEAENQNSRWLWR